MKQHSTEKIQLVNELHKPIRKKFKRRRTIIKGYDDLWQSDLAQLDLYAKHNKNFKFILVVIDCYSKFVWCRALKSKSGEEVAEAFSNILKSEKRHPKNLQTDQGKEYYNAHFQNLMKSYNINHYSTFSATKASIAERSVKTIKQKLFYYFTLNGTYKWIDILPDIVRNYNNQKHRTINMKPSEVKKNTNLTAYNHPKIATDHQKFKVGDFVRISKAKHIFEKGYTPNWTTELFKITKVQITNPVTYLLNDLHDRPIMGCFYTEELQKAVNPDVYLVEKILKKKGRKVYVKWLGMDKSHNSWIDATNKL